MKSTRMPRRRWLQFSLRTVLLGVSALAVCLGLAVGRAHRQRQIVATIVQRGGSARAWRVDSRWRPKWVLALLGDEYAPREHWNVVLNRGRSSWHRDVRRNAAGDETLALAAELRPLDSLSLRETVVSDVGLRYVSDLRELEELRLDRTKVGDVGLGHLRGLACLRTLELSETRVTDAGLVSVAALGQLRYLDLRDTQVTDAGLRHLRELAGLRELRLSKTNVGDAALDHLRGLTRIEALARTIHQVANASTTKRPVF